MHIIFEENVADVGYSMHTVPKTRYKSCTKKVNTGKSYKSS